METWKYLDWDASTKGKICFIVYDMCEEHKVPKTKNILKTTRIFKNINSIELDKAFFLK